MNKKILILDDSLMMRKLLASIIKGQNIETDLAANGQDGLDLLTNNPDAYSAVLVDWDMPVMNGIEFVRAVRAQAQYNDTKLIMVTAHNSMDDLVNAMSEAIDDYLMKPLNEEMVIDKLRIAGILD